MTPHEAGAVTKHHTVGSMRGEIEQISARVMQELLDYCGRRGIAKLQVSCNHAMRKTLTSPSMTQAEQRSLRQQRAKTSMDKLYRVSLDQNQIRKISNWRTTALSQVAALMTVEYETGYDFDH